MKNLSNDSYLIAPSKIENLHGRLCGVVCYLVEIMTVVFVFSYQKHSGWRSLWKRLIQMTTSKSAMGVRLALVNENDKEPLLIGLAERLELTACHFEVYFRRDVKRQADPRHVFNPLLNIASNQPSFIIKRRKLCLVGW